MTVHMFLPRSGRKCWMRWNSLDIHQCRLPDRTIKYSVKEYLNGAEGKLVISNYEDAAETEGSGMRYADEVILSNDEDGVAVVLERILSLI